MDRRVALTAPLLFLTGVAATLTAGTPILAAPPDEKPSSDQGYEELARLAEPLLAYNRVFAKLTEVVRPAVVHIEVVKPTDGGWTKEAGSGVIVRIGDSPRPKILTSRHVVRDAPSESITVHLADDSIFHPVRVLGDADTDVAVLEVDSDDLPVARLGDSDAVGVGHLVVALGSPFNHPGSVTMGIISAKHRRGLPLRGGSRSLLNQDFLQTDAAINPGSSGGPLVNLRGEVIGINTAIASQSGEHQGVAFSAPINLVKRVAENLLRTGRVSRAFLGVDLDLQFTERTAKQLGLERPRGALVAGIYDSSPADAAGLLVHDVILTLDGRDIKDHADLINAASLTPVGKEVEAVVWRGRKRQPVRLTVGDRETFEQRIAHQSRQRNAEFAQLLSDGTPGDTIASLGMVVRRLSGAQAEAVGFESGTHGLLVLEVKDKGLASQQVEQFDVIDQVERQGVASIEELRDAMSGLDLSEGVLLRLRRLRGSRPHTRMVLVIR